MQKTRLGISVGLAGAIFYCLCLFGGYFPVILMAAYILLCEENPWLKKNAVKGVVILIGFSLLSSVIYILPNLLDIISNIIRIFNGHFQLEFISNLVYALSSILSFLEKLLFLGLGLTALNQGSIGVPVVDKLIDKYM